MTKRGTELITEERIRQIESEGWTSEHDAEHIDEELALVASFYATPLSHRKKGIPIDFPWATVWWKPTPDNRVRELQKAGALIAAEIDRLQN